MKLGRRKPQILLLFAMLTLATCSQEEPPSGEPTSNSSFEEIQIEVGEFVFDALAAGPEDGELVLLLHGFPQSGYSYRHQLPILAEAGYRAVAPNQRGYSPGARPEGVSNYALPLIVQDTVGMADALGREQFHLVGHDWGGAAAWLTASLFPDRILSLTVFSTPHFAAFGAELADPESDQSQRSSYFAEFGAEGAEERFLADNAEYLKSILKGTGSNIPVSDEEIQPYLDLLSDPEAMRAALNWYRALNQSRASAPQPTGAASPPPVNPIEVPTLYIWSDQDPAFGPEAARATEQYVAAPYRFEVIEGVGHWIPEQAAERVNPLLLEHLQMNSRD